MRSFILPVLFLFHLIQVQAQCVIEHWPLAKRIDKSSLIVEGKVIDQKAVWDAEGKNIYTIHRLEVYRCFKGSLSSDYIELVTAGGTIGDEMHRADPSLELNMGAIGIYLLTDNTLKFNEHEVLYAPTASTESFVSYDLLESKAYDVDANYHSISYDLYQTIQAETGQEIAIHIPFNAEASKGRIRALATPVINSVDLDTISSGTQTVLSISGSNFGIVRGNGKVGFKDADYGDGRFYYTPIGISYVSWSNSQIKISVPTKAGTGAIQVVNNSGESGVSSFDLQVKYAHTNVLYATSASDTNFYQTRHVDMNNSGGYTWQMTPQFASKEDAVKAFYRSLETWRCATFMNWNVGSDTSLDQTASDNVNIVRFDDLAGNRLGTCWSRWSGCYSTTNATWYWYVRELDIEFDSTYDWHYAETATPTGKYDFQSVASHELGHGHQLSHVRDNTKMMHYSIGAGIKKDELSSYDIEGGTFVKDNSTASGVCGKSAMTALTGSSCSITVPVVKFSISDTILCPNEEVTLTNLTEGNSLSFAWSFGANASTASSTSAGPHDISYDSAGIKTIKLIVENSFGKDSLEKVITVLNPTPDRPNSFIIEDTACLGNNDYQLDSVPYATNYAWAVSNGGSFVGGSSGIAVTVNWTTSGQKVVTAVAIGECGNSPQQKDTVEILGDAVAAFGEQVDGLQIDFSSSSQHAMSYSWDFGDGETSEEENPTHQYGDKGTYAVKLKVSNACGSDSVTKDITVAFRAGFDELNNIQFLYPNPASSGELIQLPGGIADSYQLFEMQGQQVSQGELKAQSMRLPKLVDGMYVLLIRRGESFTVFKLRIDNNR